MSLRRLLGTSLRSRLLRVAGILTVIVVGGASYLKDQITERLIEAEARDAAEAAALGLAADLTEQEGLPTPGELDETLADVTQQIPQIRALAVTRFENGQSRFVAGTEPGPPSGCLTLANQASISRNVVMSPELPGPVRLLAVPLERHRQVYGAVVVTVSMEALERVRRQSRLAASLVALAAVLALTVLIDLMATRLVHQPLLAIRETMRRASEGDLAARARVDREDEIGSVALGLNAMLERMAGFNTELRLEVERATDELRHKNTQLEESTQRLFAARRELSRLEQLAVAGKMAATVAHQIGTPLNLISGYVQMIQEELPEDSASVQRLGTVQGQIAKVAAIVQGLLDQSRGPALRRSPVTPAELVTGACDLAQPTLATAGIALEERVEPGLPAIWVDLTQLEQVFLNLITNSIDAMPEGGRLRVEARLAAPDVEFVVADSGSGIPSQHLERIFDPLFTTKLPGKGTGLGLTIARDVVQAHGGRISVASQPGQGTTIRFRIPAERADA